MSQPHLYRQAPARAQHRRYPRSYPPAPQAYSPPQPSPRRGHGVGVPWGAYPAAAAPGDQRLFSVRVTKHTGLVMLCYNQRYTITGTLAQCEAAIAQAQQHNLLAGWWSVASLLVWNWVALLENHGARTALRRQAPYAYAADPRR